jgi:uncharacterized integral membrane protein
MQSSTGAALVLLTLIIVFFVLNTDPVTVSLLVTEQSVSLALVIIISTLFGFLLGLISPRIFRRREERFTIPQNEADARNEAPQNE